MLVVNKYVQIFSKKKAYESLDSLPGNLDCI